MAACAAGLAALAVSQTRADTIGVSTQSVTGGAGALTFTYNAELTESPDPSGGSAPDAQVLAGNFFTIYDFGPVTSATLQPGWTLVQSPLGTTAIGTVPADNPFILNATLLYTGAIINADPVTDLGDFTLTSNAPSAATVPDNFTSQDNRELINDGIEDVITSPTLGGNIGFVSVPAQAFAVPTPTAALGGFALLGLLAFKKRRAL